MLVGLRRTVDRSSKRRLATLRIDFSLVPVALFGDNFSVRWSVVRSCAACCRKRPLLLPQSLASPSGVALLMNLVLVLNNKQSVCSMSHVRCHQ